jgi:hypothetical protein
VPRLYFQRLALEIVLVHLFDRRLGLLLRRHGHESKPTRLAGRAVANDLHGRHGSEGGKCLTQFVFGDARSQIAHIDVHVTVLSVASQEFVGGIPANVARC